MTGMKFTKMHGLGNDYVFVDCFDEHVEDPAAVARAVSDRHTGIGGDGLILIGPSNLADVRMTMYNTDGSRAEMCGNGIRCVAKYAVEHQMAAAPELRIETDAGVKRSWCQMLEGKVASVRIDMGRPSLAVADLPSTLAADRIVDHPLLIDGVTYVVTAVSMGNPHVVLFVDDLHAIPAETLGPKFEYAPEFPKRVNVQFVEVDSPEHVTVRTWERGSGVTRACGTGACAVCVAGAITGRTRRKLVAGLPGGDLDVEWAQDDHVYMTGPAVEVFTGEWPA
jgi:diaminopimelate epimerase